MTKEYKFSKEEINNIINLRDTKNNQLDIFNLGGVLYLDDGDNSKTNNMFSAHSLFIDYDSFFWCETEEDVNEQFFEELKSAVMEQLL